jgi:hypothetical protein
MSYAPGKLYGVSETSVRVRDDFWRECEENRELIRETAVYINADPEWPRDFPLSILVMSKDQPTGCVYFEGPEDFVELTKLRAEWKMHTAKAAALQVRIGELAA